MAGEDENTDQFTLESFRSFQSVTTGEVQAAITGYEIVEARKRFTVFQINVQPGNGRSWFLFRRYSDFMKLDQDLKELFPEFSAKLPPKKYFGNNFDSEFLEMRKENLQTYLQCLLCNQRVLSSQASTKFFCFDDPPGPYDSLQESRALIESLEDNLIDLRNRIVQLESEMKLAKSQLRQAQSQKHALLVALRAERVLNGKCAHDNDDQSLLQEYNALAEVKTLDLRKFARDNARDQEEILSQTNLKPRYRSYRGRGAFPLSSSASQWDITNIEVSEGFKQAKSDILLWRQYRSISDLRPRAHTTEGKRNTSHLPNCGKKEVSTLNSFLRQSTEALNQIRLTVRQKLGNSKTESQKKVPEVNSPNYGFVSD